MSVITDHKILDWRRDQLLRAGFQFDHACTLAANGDVDLHAAVALAKAAGATYAFEYLS